MSEQQQCGYWAMEVREVGSKDDTRRRWVVYEREGILKMQHMVDGKWEFVPTFWINDKDAPAA